MTGGPAALVVAVNRRGGYGLRLDGVAEHGETGGAAYVCWPDGRPGVVTTAEAGTDRMRQTGEVLAWLRDQGIPVPRQVALVELTDATLAVVQERLPGTPARHADAVVVESMLAMCERFAGLLADRPDVPVPALRSGTPEHPWHQSLAKHDDRTRRMLDRIRAVAADDPREHGGDDLLHTDYTVPNVLFDGMGGSAGSSTGTPAWPWRSPVRPRQAPLRPHLGPRERRRRTAGRTP